MKLYLIDMENGNGTRTIANSPSAFHESKEITETEALELLYADVDPMKDYDISEYKLIGPNSYGRFGIDYK